VSCFRPIRGREYIADTDAEDVSYMTRKLKEEFTKWGLEINM
jgi:hypothetical protein